MAEAQDIAAKLEQAFRRIQAERMEGVPILNKRLGVEAVGVRAWNGAWLVGMVTPWFINLMLLPEDAALAEAWAGLKLGLNVTHGFPSGGLEFLVGEEASIGRYMMCSLFSPVLEFADHEAAHLAAEAALEALFAESEPEPEAASSSATLSRRGLFGGRREPAEESAG
jgi:[NiFe] hydrogenase assembly HybE family chaperone